jgi:hypothetical protein
MPAPAAAILPILTVALNWNALNATQRGYSTFALDTNRNGSIVKIQANAPSSHLMGLEMRTTPQRKRDEMQATGQTKAKILGFHLDRGIFTSWRFIGSTGPDTLTFGSQGVIISKRATGSVDFGKDNAPDVFTFTNKIDVAKCSEKHGIQCHPLNHLQQVVIKNFGPEDIIDLQGRKYRYSDVKGGALPDVPIQRLRVELLK